MEEQQRGLPPKVQFAHGTVLAITSRTIQESVGAVNDESDTGWIRAKRCFDETVELYVDAGVGW